MAQEVAIDILINTDQAGKSLKELKDFIKEGNNELAKLEIGSEQYTKLASKIGQAKDTVNELRETTALAAEGAFTAIADVGSKIASGFQVASGAMALFGNDSKDLQKTLAQVQGAMAMAQGIKQLEDLGRTFKNLKTTVLDFGKNVVSTLQKMYATMLANPITALVVAIAALAAGIIYLMNSEDDETEALKKNIAEREKQMAQMEKENTIINSNAKFRYDLAKARGASETELFKIESENNALRIKQLEEQNNNVRKNLNENTALRKKASGDEKNELIDKYNEQIQLLDKNKAQIAAIKQSAIIKEAEIEKKAADDAKAKDKEAADRRKQNAEKGNAEAEKQAQLQAELNKALANLRVENIEDERKKAVEKLQLDYETQRKEYETKFKGKQQLQELLLQLDTKYLGDNIALQKKFDDEDLEKNKEAEQKRIESKIESLDLEYNTLKSQREINIQDEIDLENSKYETLKSNKYLSTLEIEKIQSDHDLKMAELTEKQIQEQNNIYLENKEIEIEQKQNELAEKRLNDETTFEEERELARLREEVILGDITKSNEEKIAARIAYDEEIKKIDEAEAARKRQLISQGLDAAKGGLQATADLVNAFAGKSKAEQKKAFDFQKGVNIATATIDTYKAATAAFASAGNPIVGAIFAAIAVAAGIANIAKISSTQFEDKSGPSSSAATGPGASMGAFNPSLGAPVSNTSTNLASIGFNNSNEQPQVKVFVAETDISNTQNKVKSIEQKASIE
jgi:hypothetical protein